MKEIQLPVGFVIDYEKSTDNKIVLKEEEVKILTWEEIQKNHGKKQTTQYYVTDYGTIHGMNSANRENKSLVNNVPSLNIAKKIIALCQMYIIANYYNKEYGNDWVGDWKNDNHERVYTYWNNKNNCVCFKVAYVYSHTAPYFANIELAKLAYKNNKKIFETALKP